MLIFIYMLVYFLWQEEESDDILMVSSGETDNPLAAEANSVSICVLILSVGLK